MRGRSLSRAWTKGFAAGLLVRPILIVPMAPSGPLGGSDLLPLALASVFAGSLPLAVGVYVGIRLAIAFGIFTAVAGVVVAAIGGYLGLPMPWPLAMAAYNLGLAAVGVRAWHEPRLTTG
ncbi:MAG: hypothetical protein AB1627_07855 [Chloroflexota bacterium]